MSKTFLAKAKLCDFEDVLLGKLTIPKTDEVYEKESEEGKRKRIITYTELISSIDDKTSNGKVAFNLIKDCESKERIDGNAFTAWERLKNKFEPSSAPYLVMIEK